MVAALDDSGMQRRDLNLRELVIRLWGGRLLIVSCGLGFAVLFGVLAWRMTPIFRATAVLVVVDSNSADSMSTGGGTLGALTTILDGGAQKGSAVEEALAVLRSREFTEAFIRDLRLMPELYPDKWDAGANAWRVSRQEQPTPAQAARYFSKLRTARQDLYTGLVEVQIEWRDREKAALWANTLVARLNEVMRARAIARADAYIGYLQKELAVTAETETREALGRLLESQLNQRMFAHVTREYAFRVVDTALVPDVRSRPKRALLVMLGGVTGFFIGCVAVFSLHSLRSQTSV